MITYIHALCMSPMPMLIANNTIIVLHPLIHLQLNFVTILHICSKKIIADKIRPSGENNYVTYYSVLGGCCPIDK